MALAASNGEITLTADTWTLIGEANITFQAISDHVEILCMDGAAPADATVVGVHYPPKYGEVASTDLLAEFPGAGTADRVYAISRGEAGRVFVSRAAT